MRLVPIIILINLIFSYSIIQSESNLQYFGSHPIHNFSGSSSSIILFSDCNEFSDECNFKFSIPIISLNSGNDNRDSNMLNYLEAFSYPEISLTVENFKIKNYKEELIPVDIKIHGMEQTINIPLTLVESLDRHYIAKSSFSILLSDFNVEIPKLLFLPISNEIIIKVQVAITKD